MNTTKQGLLQNQLQRLCLFEAIMVSCILYHVNAAHEGVMHIIASIESDMAKRWHIISQD